MYTLETLSPELAALKNTGLYDSMFALLDPAYVNAAGENESAEERQAAFGRMLRNDVSQQVQARGDRADEGAAYRREIAAAGKPTAERPARSPQTVMAEDHELFARGLEMLVRHSVARAEYLRAVDVDPATAY